LEPQFRAAIVCRHAKVAVVPKTLLGPFVSAHSLKVGLAAVLSTALTSSQADRFACTM
jgi:hypothetical protein